MASKVDIPLHLVRLALQVPINLHFPEKLSYVIENTEQFKVLHLRWKRRGGPLAPQYWISLRRPPPRARPAPTIKWWRLLLSPLCRLHTRWQGGGCHLLLFLHQGLSCRLQAFQLTRWIVPGINKKATRLNSGIFWTSNQV